MKPGLEINHQESVGFSVTTDMFAQFEGQIVHPAYSTVSMVYHMEWASRKIILPFLEDHEEGMGAEVKVKHLAPTLEGSKVTVTAKLVEIRGNVIVTDCFAENEAGLIGTGHVTQIILPKILIEQKFMKLR